MIPPTFDYVRPKTLSEAISLLSRDSEAKILAGGHSLVPLMRFRMASPTLLIDINKVQGLSYIKEDGDWLKIGAMTRESELDRSELVQKSYPLLADTTRVIADPLVRNLATIGGNIAHADPANDHPATMLAYGAEIGVAGPKGERSIPIGEFFLDAFTTALRHDEILTEARIPIAVARSGGAYLKLERKVGDFATAAVAVQLWMDSASKVASAGIGLTNVGVTPIQASAAETELEGKTLDDDAIKKAAQMASDAAEPIEDHRGSEAYKRSLVRTLTYRAMKKAWERAEGGAA